jgi:protein O-GlcNAc transferase
MGKSEPPPSPSIAAMLQEAVAHHRRGQLAQAEAIYRRILGLVPKHFDALHLLGVIEHQRKHYDAAVRLIGRALTLNPKHAAAQANLGLVFRDLNRPQDALDSFDRALRIEPDLVEALNCRGGALYKLGRHVEALASYDRALALQPDHVEALNNRGTVLSNLKRHAEALASYDRALALRPGQVEVLNNRGVALRDLERPEEAIASFDSALSLNPDNAETLNNRGNALLDLMRFAAALASYDRAVALRPDYVEALNNRGYALRGLGRHEEALASLDRALALKPDHVEALNNRGIVLHDLGHHDRAARDFAQLLGARPDFDYARGNLLSQQLRCCDWQDYDASVKRIESDALQGKLTAPPFAFLSISGSPAAQLQCARTFNRDKYPASADALWRGERYGHGRIRIAYLSADFHGHATAYLMAELFEAQDKARFETIALSFGPDSKDEWRARLKKSFGRFIEVRGKSDRDAALLLNELEIDIAVDLKGYTQDNRTGILAFRPAPIQVSYLGYPGTMGADYVDYILADRYVIPEDQHAYYSEKIACLPDSYQPNDSKRRISERTPTRAEAGLPETGFVFCSFNSNSKITPPMFGIWMRLLRQVEGSVLWLLADNAAAVRNLRREAERRGVAPDRLVFAPRMRLEDHLARHRLADLFLDTLPYNAHTTASDALWAGLPILTCLGSSFAGRVAASLLNAVGLPELITDTLDGYEALALKLARDRDSLMAIRAKLAQNRATAPLFDTDRFRRHIESAYETMWERYQRGEPPASFAVAAGRER